MFRQLGAILAILPGESLHEREANREESRDRHGETESKEYGLSVLLDLAMP